MNQLPPSSFSAGNDDIRPAVRVVGSNRGLWVFAAIMAGFAMMLFSLLEARRQTAPTSPIESLTEPSRNRISAPPDLFIPGGNAQSGTTPPADALPSAEAAGIVAQPSQQPVERSDRPAVHYSARPQRYIPPDPPAPIPYVQPIPQVPYDAGNARPNPSANAMDPASRQDRVTAFRFANPATTVPKGTIIQAVLETALDSTRAGFARAIVTRDVPGFDGSRILIPRGSRLVGEYESELTPSQNRALIQWQRLMRPDGVLINLDSPAIDPLGRAGVRGKVDSHFLERFAGALLQTAVGIGSQVALNRASNSAVVYAVPTTGQSSQMAQPERVQRTLKVKQGASVSVFVAKDLDFTTVEP